MTYQRKKLGNVGEDLAAQFLVSKGYQILDRNLKTRYGEIDILALDRKTTVIVEVKTKTGLGFGVPAEMVTRQKQAKLRALTLDLVNQRKLANYRIDVIAIDLSGQEPIIEHLISAI